MATIPKLPRKSRDTRELVYFLGAPDFTGDGYPLDGATVTITIWHPTGRMIQSAGVCAVLSNGTETVSVDGVSYEAKGSWVAYYPLETDFDDLGTYEIEWTSTHADGRTARWPSGSTSKQGGPFALVEVNEALDTRAA